MTVAQLNLLTSIANAEPVRSGRLADGLSMEISTLSRNVSLLERRGWVEVLHAERGNGRVLRLTAAGASKLEQLMPAWESAQQEACELLGPGGARAIHELADPLLPN